MPVIVYARHAESTWNAAGRWQGQADPPLSARGRAQAEALAGRLGGRGGIGLLATSPLARARQTAEILGARLGLEPRPVDALKELDAGVWSGLTRAEVERRFPEELARFLSGDPEVCAGGGESRSALAARVAGALRELFSTASGGDLAVVGHLGALRSLLPDARLDNADFLELPAHCAAGDEA